MKVVFYCILLILSNSLVAQKVEVQYLANEGILIKAKDAQVLIDAVFTKEFDFLDVLPESELENIGTAESRFRSIDIVLSTHLHGDHFNAQLTGAHLRANPNAMFLGPNETVNSFKENFKSFDQIASRVESESPALYESKTVSLKSIGIRILRMEHFGTSPWKEAENVAFLISIGNKKILHLGDSKVDARNLERFNLAVEDIDVTIIPYWQIGSSEQKEIIEKFIGPKQLFIAHIPLKDQGVARENINSLGYKNFQILIEQFQTYILE